MIFIFNWCLFRPKGVLKQVGVWKTHKYVLGSWVHIDLGTCRRYWRIKNIKFDWLQMVLRLKGLNESIKSFFSKIPLISNFGLWTIEATRTQNCVNSMQTVHKLTPYFMSPYITYIQDNPYDDEVLWIKINIWTSVITKHNLKAIYRRIKTKSLKSNKGIHIKIHSSLIFQSNRSNHKKEKIKSGNNNKLIESKPSESDEHENDFWAPSDGHSDH